MRRAMVVSDYLRMSAHCLPQSSCAHARPRSPARATARPFRRADVPPAWGAGCKTGALRYERLLLLPQGASQVTERLPNPTPERVLADALFTAAVGGPVERDHGCHCRISRDCRRRRLGAPAVVESSSAWKGAQPLHWQADWRHLSAR
jgi:hypothetical protein